MYNLLHFLKTSNISCNASPTFNSSILAFTLFPKPNTESINSLSNNTSILSKLCECCCENRLAICQQTNALQSTLAANHADDILQAEKNAAGLQLGSIVNYTRGDFAGMQVSAINHNGTFYGFQVGAFNYDKGVCWGLQVGVANSDINEYRAITAEIFETLPLADHLKADW